MTKALKYGFLILGVIIIIVFTVKGNVNHQEFNSEKWKNWTETEQKMSLRWDMMNSLRNNHELKGKTKTEIVQLLGKPDSKTEIRFRYYLGMAKIGIDIGTLTIKFNEDGKVIDYNVRRS